MTDRQRALSVELTLREVPFLDDLVYLVRRRASALEAELGVCGRCNVTVQAVWNGSLRAYLTRIEVRDGGLATSVQAADRDLFDAIDQAFAATRCALAEKAREPATGGGRDVRLAVRRPVLATG